MATTREEFQVLADELINDEFADFRKTLVITFGGGYDPVTESTSAGTELTVQAIPNKLELSEALIAAGIQINDKMVVYKATTPVPTVGLTCVFDSVPCQVVGVMQDAADAAIKLILRGL